MECIVGFIALAVTIVTLWIVSSRDGYRLRGKAVAIVGYNGAALAAFLLIPRTVLSFHTSVPGLLCQPAFQLALTIVAATCLGQTFLLCRTSSLFGQVVGPTIVSVVAAPALLYSAGFGIIHVTWTMIIAGSTAGYVFVAAIYDLLEPVIAAPGEPYHAADRKERLTYIRDELNRLLQLALTAYTALAASVGVSMTILFRGGAPAWSNFENQVRALSMTVGFAFVSLGLLLWLVKPYLDTYLRVRYYFEQQVPDPELDRRGPDQQEGAADGVRATDPLSHSVAATIRAKSAGEEDGMPSSTDVRVEQLMKCVRQQDDLVHGWTTTLVTVEGGLVAATGLVWSAIPAVAGITLKTAATIALAVVAVVICWVLVLASISNLTWQGRYVKYVKMVEPTLYPDIEPTPGGWGRQSKLLALLGGAITTFWVAAIVAAAVKWFRA